MADQSIKKVDSRYSPHGEMGQKYLVSGKRLSMRLWELKQGEEGEPHARPYEIVGYVVKGRVEITVGDSTITCGSGDSYLIPDGAERSYRVLENLVAVEATAPAAQVHHRDED